MKKVLITGISGFVGKYLTDYLLYKNEYEIFGTFRTKSPQTEKLKNDVSISQMDLLDSKAASSLLASIQPDYIYHLAAMSSPAESYKTPDITITNNIISESNILNALLGNKLQKARVMIVSSADIYGKVSYSDLPVDEETPLQPLSPYAVSKIAQDYLGLQYYLSYSMDIVRVRPFGHTGPMQSDRFVVPSFAKQIAEIEKGKREPVLKVGNLEPKRDFTDVHDIVKAYEMLMVKGLAGEAYNIGSGRSIGIQEILDILLSFTEKKIEIEQDPQKMRPVDVREIRCDYTKLNTLTGWKPEIPIERTLKNTLDYWRGIV